MIVPSSTSIRIAKSSSATVKFRERNVRRSSSAEFVRCSLSCRRTNTVIATPPTTSGIHAGGVPGCRGTPSRLKPHTAPPNASTERTTDRISSGASRGVVTFSMRRHPSHNDASAIGSTSTNSQRQCR